MNNSNINEHKFWVRLKNSEYWYLLLGLILTDGLNSDLHLDISNRVSLEKVDKFCYLGDMLHADGGCDSAVTTRVGSAWKKFREYLPILTGKGFSLKLKGKVYATCVRSCLMHGSETWPMKVEHELKNEDESH